MRISTGIKKNLIILVIWLGIWYLISLLIHQELVFPSPFSVIRTLYDLMQTKRFWISCSATVLRIMTGILIGTLVSLFLVVISCCSSFVYDLLNPLVRIVRSTPVASFSILALLWFGKDKIAVLMAILMVIPIVFESVIRQFQETDPLLLEMFDAYHLPVLKKIKYLYIPSIKPVFIASFSNAIGFAWKAGIAAEVLALPLRAIGTNLYNAKVYLETTELFAWTTVVIIISSLIEKAIRHLITGSVKNEDR